MLTELLQNLEIHVSQMGHFQIFLTVALLTFIQEDAVLLLCAALVARGSIDFEIAFWSNTTGVLLGDFVLYAIAAWLGRFRENLWLIGRLLKPERLAIGKKLFDRWGFGIVILSKFTPALRTPLYLSMGFVRSGFWIFALAISLSGALWVFFILKGVLKADQLGLLPVFLGVLMVALICAQILSWWFKKSL